MAVVVPSILVILIIIFGGISVYLVEHEHQDANITNLGGAFCGLWKQSPLWDMAITLRLQQLDG